MPIHEIALIASSDANTGAINKSADGSTFEIILDEPIMVPGGLRSCTVEMQEATVWWVTPNISAALGNNHWHVEHATVVHDITIQDGLYSLSDLNATLDRELQIVSGLAGLITLSADNATQKVNIQINQATTQIDLTPANTFRDIIGFDSQLIPAAAPSVGVFNQLGDNVAAFNTIDYFLIHSDIVNQGIRVNNTYNHTIGQVLIDVAPGSQIVSRPFNPPKSDALELSGAIRSRIKFWLTDQADQNVNTNNESFSCRVIIKYKV